MHIIIDGYNLIRQSPSLSRLERISLEEGRKGLIRRLSAYRKLRGNRITVVFDGWIDGASRETRLKEGGLQIVYSRRGEQADEVIKRMSRKRGEEIVVVTSDRDVADAAVRSGNVALASAVFEMRMALDEIAPAGQDDFFPDEQDDSESGRNSATKKRGPSRKLSKRERQARKVLKKL